MTEYFYRYRPINAVLDEFHELESQEIYFGTADELNDPMEGFKDLFWHGDAIVWRSFLKHYMLCLLKSTYYCFAAADEFDPHFLRDMVLSVPQNLPDAPAREVYRKVVDKLMAEPAVQTFVSLMSSRTTPIRRNELTGYLRALHGFAVRIIFSDFQERGLFIFKDNGMQALSREDLTRHAIAIMESATKIKVSQQLQGAMLECLFGANAATFDQAMLLAEYHLPDRDKKKPIVFLLDRFPVAYIAALDKLVHRDWYLACFTTSADNHSMWSTYANGHRGVCLVFKATANAAGVRTLPLEMITGAHGSRGRPITYSSSFVAHELKPVQYTAQYPAIDFFRSLGTIPEMDVNSFWYLSDDGSFSKCRDAIYADTDAWRSKYWHTFGESALYKTPEWAHEQEYRIVLHSGFDMSTRDKRKLKYRFGDLTGIVFGARTDIEDKLKLMRVVDAKCAKEKRSDFAFSEIRYLDVESRFQLFPLNLLKMEHR